MVILISRQTAGALRPGYGSVHHAIKSLEKRGLLEEAGRARDPGTPERILYRRTAAGEKLLQEAHWAVSPPEYGAKLSGDGLYLAALGILPGEKRRALLEKALEQARERFEKLRRALGEGSPLAPAGVAAPDAPQGLPASDAGRVIALRHLQHLFAEISWLEGLLM